MYYLEFHEPLALTPEHFVHLVEKAVVQLHQAFGAPGNYGYETPKGNALQCMYAALDMIRALKQTTAGQTTTPAQ